MVGFLPGTGINHGRYRFPADLHKKAPKDDFGGKSGRTERVRRIWIDFRTRGGSESNDGEQMASLNVFEFRTPWSPDAIDSGMEIHWNGQEYEIEAVWDSDFQHSELVLTVRRRNDLQTASRSGRFA